MTYDMNYEAAAYKREWGVFHKPTRNWMVFGTRSAMVRRAKELNDLDRSQHEMCLAEIARLSKEQA